MVSIGLLQHSNFQASKLFINVPVPTLLVPGHGPYLELLGFRVPLDHIGVPGPGSH